MSVDDRDLPSFPSEVFAERRARVLEALGNGAMVLTSGANRFRAGDDDSPHRPDSELFYLTGFTEPGAVAVIRGFAEEDRFSLFVRPSDPKAELWTGTRLGPDEARERFGPDACHPLGELDERLPTLLAGADRVHFRLGSDAWADELVRASLGHARARGPRTGSGPRAVVDPGGILDEMRIRKDPLEQEALRRAATLSIAGHQALLLELGTGAGEWELEAAIEGAFRRGGSGRPAYPTIIASGVNACVLHYRENHSRVTTDDVVLVDAAAELDHYCADVTRTYPAGSRFTAEQRVVYDVVERARAAAVAAVQPGASLDGIHELARGVLIEGLAELGVLSGSVDEIIEDKTYQDYFPHRTSHWLGLDTHDVGDYARGGAPRPLVQGMVFTIEPGLYFSPVGAGSTSQFAGIGVRIEDDVLVTEGGHENLTVGLPTAAEAVEDLVAG